MKSINEMNRYELLGLTKGEAEEIDGLLIVNETGEVTTSEEVEKLIAEKNDKIMAYQRVCAQYAEMYKAQAKAFAELANLWDKKADAIAQSEKHFMIVGGKKKINGVWGQASLRKSTVVEITDDATALNNLYETYPDLFNVKITPSKTEIKKALKAGSELEGCALVEKQNISIM